MAEHGRSNPHCCGTVPGSLPAANAAGGRGPRGRRDLGARSRRHDRTGHSRRRIRGPVPLRPGRPPGCRWHRRLRRALRSARAKSSRTACSGRSSRCPASAISSRWRAARAASASRPSRPIWHWPGPRPAPGLGILDADIYGPSQPLMLGLEGQRPTAPDGKHLVPLEAHGLKAMSIGFLVDAAQAVVWRGPMVTQALTQLLGDTRLGRTRLPRGRHAAGHRRHPADAGATRAGVRRRDRDHAAGHGAGRRAQGTGDVREGRRCRCWASSRT